MKANVFNPDFLDFIESLNAAEVRYLLVGGYAVVLHGYHRATGDLDIWVEKTESNYHKISLALKAFGIPLSFVIKEEFLGTDDIDVFTFGRPPVAIDLLTSVKGLNFTESYMGAKRFLIQGVEIRVVNSDDLIAAKKASGRFKDLDDIDHLVEE